MCCCQPARPPGLVQHAFLPCKYCALTSALRSLITVPPSCACRFVDDAELAYVITRARQVHDFWHVLFGCHTNVFGEVALKAVEFVQVRNRSFDGSACFDAASADPISVMHCQPPCCASRPAQSRRALLQTGLPMTGLAVLAGEWRLKAEDRRLLNEQFLPWALHAGARAPDLMCIYYEKHFQESLEELRLRWRIEVAPSVQQNMQRAARLQAPLPLSGAPV